MVTINKLRMDLVLGGVTQFSDGIKKVGDQANRVTNLMNTQYKAQQKAARATNRAHVLSERSGKRLQQAIEAGNSAYGKNAAAVKKGGTAAATTAQNTKSLAQSVSSVGTSALASAASMGGLKIAAVGGIGAIAAGVGLAIAGMAALIGTFNAAGQAAVRLKNQITHSFATAEQFQRVAGAMNLVTLGISESRAAAAEAIGYFNRFAAAVQYGLGQIDPGLSRLLTRAGQNIHVFARLSQTDKIVSLAKALKDTNMSEVEMSYWLAQMPEALRATVLQYSKSEMSQDQLKDAIDNARIKTQAQIDAAAAQAQAFDNAKQSLVLTIFSFVRALHPLVGGLLSVANNLGLVSKEAMVQFNQVEDRQRLAMAAQASPGDKHYMTQEAQDKLRNRLDRELWFARAEDRGVTVDATRGGVHAAYGAGAGSIGDAVAAASYQPGAIVQPVGEQGNIIGVDRPDIRPGAAYVPPAPNVVDNSTTNVTYNVDIQATDPQGTVNELSEYAQNQPY